LTYEISLIEYTRQDEVNHPYLERVMWVSLNTKSANEKVGPIPVSTTEEGSCPTECPLKGTDCYARFGPLGMHWRKIGEGGRGDNWDSFCKRVERFPKGQLWRHNQAGDLPQDENGRIDSVKTEKLGRASAHTKGWTYTHYDPTDSQNREAIVSLNKAGGLTVNLSADNMAEADEYSKLGIGPVVVILPQDAPTRGNKTPLGLPIVVCPAQTQDTMTCDQCKLCQVRDRKSIVGFLAHGTAKKRLSHKLESQE
jgi:hypothetical protein